MLAEDNPGHTESYEDNAIGRLDEARMIRLWATNELGSRADSPGSVPAVIVQGMIDELKADYIAVVEIAKLRLDDTWAVYRKRLVTLEKEEITEAAHHLANCCLVHSSWYMPARNALGAVLRSITLPAMHQYVNPVFGANTTQAFFRLHPSFPELGPLSDLFLFAAQLGSLSHLDLDFGSFGPIPETFASQLRQYTEPHLQSLVIRGIEQTICVETLTALLETPHSSIKTVTLVLFSVLQFVDFGCLTPDEAMIPSSLLSESAKGALIRFNIIETMMIEMRSSMSQPRMTKISCGRTPTGSFTVDELTVTVEHLGLSEIDEFGKRLLAQVRSLTLECDKPARRALREGGDVGEEVKDFFNFTGRSLFKLHIRVRIPDSTSFNALSDLPTSVEDLFISLTTHADELGGLDVWDHSIRERLINIPDGSLKTLHVSVSTSFKHSGTLMPKCEEWCIQNGVNFIGSLGGHNLYR